MSRDDQQSDKDLDVHAEEEEDIELGLGVLHASAEAGSEEPAPRRHSERSSRPFAETVPVNGASAGQEGRPCIIIGASGSGKTSLLLAIHRACHMPDGDNLELAFVAEEATHNLIKKSTQIVTELTGGPQATDVAADDQDYPFRIEARTVKRAFLEAPVRASIHMVVKDVPGGALLPEDKSQEENRAFKARRDEVVQFAKNAGTLLFCVDATEPHSDILEAQLPKLLYEMSSVVAVSEILPERSLFSFLRRTPPPMWYRDRRCISVDRFLLLLTKVDQLCEGLESPERYANWIDPVEQARGLLGPALLNSIRSYLRPNCSFAVGVSSAWGFDQVSGHPFAGAQGHVGKGRHITPERILLDWTPFGIRDAIFYIASGRCRGTVRDVTAEDLLVRHDLEECEISRAELN
jgi:hypothetical protein